MSRYRLIQDGQPVAWAESEDNQKARSEIMHYAQVYAQDGPVKIQKHDGKRWKHFAP